jgi:hypothetical protein
MSERWQACIYMAHTFAAKSGQTRLPTSQARHYIAADAAAWTREYDVACPTPISKQPIPKKKGRLRRPEAKAPSS